MKKVFFILMSLSTSFVYSMDQQSSNQLSPQLEQPSCQPRKSFDTSSLRQNRSEKMNDGCSRKLSDPILRVRSQSRESTQFVQEENAKKFFEDKNKDKK